MQCLTPLLRRLHESILQIMHQMLVTGAAGVVYAVASTKKLLYSVFVERSEALSSYVDELAAISDVFSWASVLAAEPSLPADLPEQWRHVWQSHLQLFRAIRSHVLRTGCLPAVQTWKNGTQVFYNNTQGGWRAIVFCVCGCTSKLHGVTRWVLVSRRCGCWIAVLHRISSTSDHCALERLGRVARARGGAF